MKALLLLPLLFFACSDDHQSRGVTSETTNGGKMSGNVHSTGNTPVNGARVRLLKEDPQLPDSVPVLLAEDTTDRNGGYELHYEDTSWSGNVLVVADFEDKSCMKRTTLKHSDTLRLQAFQKIQGKVSQLENGSDPSNLEAYLLGLGRKASIDAKGEFTFPDLPVGDWILRVRSRMNGALLGEAAIRTVPSDANISKAIEISEHPVTLLDDFEMANGYSKLHALHGDAYWGVWKDSSVEHPGWFWELKPEWYERDSLSGLGQSLHVPLVPLGDSTRSSGLSLTIGGYSKTVPACWHEMENLDSVRFMAKGSGTLWFGLVVRSATDSLNNGRYSRTIVLTETWTEYKFSVEEDLPYVAEDWSSQKSIDRADARLGLIRWQTSDTADFWLDQISLVGMWPTDFLGCQEWY